MENKVDKTLKQIVVKFVPTMPDRPCANDEGVRIDASRFFDKNKNYAFWGIDVTYGEITCEHRYIRAEEHENFKRRVETILDSILVNTSQRKAVQKLIEDAYWDRRIDDEL